MVRPNRIPGIISADVYAKIETTNPGNSIKDRRTIRNDRGRGKAMKLKPGGTIIEHLRQHRHGARHRRGGQGRRARVLPPTSSRKRSMAVRLAPEVICPTDVVPRTRALLFGVASGADANCGRPISNLSNMQAHYEQTGRNLGADQGDRSPGGRRRHWRRCGVAKHFKERKPSVKAWGIDIRLGVQETRRPASSQEGLSVHHRRHRRGLPAAERRLQPDRSLEKVTDRDAAIATGRIAREGISAGNSRGRQWPAWCSWPIAGAGRSRRRSSTTRHALSRQMATPTGREGLRRS